MPFNTSAFWAENRPKMIELLNSGTRAYELASIFGCTRGQISGQINQMREKGLIKRPGPDASNAEVVFTPEMDATVRRMRASGISLDKIAKTFGLSRFTVAKHARLTGVERPIKAPKVKPPKQPRPSFWTEEKLAYFLTLYTTGTPYEDIAREIGPMTVWNLNKHVSRLREQGIVTPEHRSMFILERRRRGLTRAKQSHTPKAERAKKTQRPVVEHAPTYALAEATFAAPAGFGMPLYDLGLRHCRWPFSCDDGEVRYCGAPATDRSYCADHGARAFATAKRPLESNPAHFRISASWKEARI